MLKLITILFVCISLSACGGFKMRGALDIPPYLRTVYITPYEPNEPLQRAVRAQLIANGVKVLNSPVDNMTVLRLEKPVSNDAVLAVSTSGEVQRYNLSVSTSFSLTTANNLQIQRSITRTRELNRSNNMLLSNEGEAQIVKRELLNEVVAEMLRQITARPQHKDLNP